MTVNGISDEGAEALSEMLKKNTTLTWLALNGEEERKRERRKRKRIINDRE